MTERGATARAKVRKDDIVRRAEELFAEQGYAQTRMTDIADAAGVTKGLLYWYFENKEALVAEVLVDLRQQLRAVQREAVASVEDPLVRIYVGTVATVRFVLEHWRLFEVNIPPSAKVAEVRGASAMVHASDTAETLREGQRLGLIRDDDAPQALAQGNAGVVNQFCIARATGQLRGSVDDVAHMAARFIVRGLAADPSVVAAIEAAHGRVARPR
jgi:AcrR family transcriptional regulator